MFQPLLILCVTFTLPSIYLASTSTSGSLELDEFTFDKVVNKFETVVVKFDVAYPYGDQHDAFLTVAKETKDNDNLLFAEVGVKDYGEKDNEALAARFGATKDNFPVVKLFIKGEKDPITYDGPKTLTSDLLRQFIRDNSNVYLSLPGCIKELDELATKFMSSDKENRKNVLQETKKYLEEIVSKDNKHSINGKTYLTIMEKILEKGDDFIQTETARVNKLLDGKVSKEKKQILNFKVNILQSFKHALNEIKKEEL
ncbi:unnamed protein product, partial [Brenthis ino]